jgi:glycosyltransferase involved in cell wall biosynthesis
MGQDLPQSASDALRVLHVTPAFYPATYWGGPIHSVHSLCNALARLPGVSLRVLTTDSAGPSTVDRVEVSQIPMRFPAGYDVYYVERVMGSEIAPGMLRRLYSMICWSDVVHLTATYSFPTIPTLVACRIGGKPLVWSPRGALLATQEWPAARRRFLKRLWELLCNCIVTRESCMLHATSEAERRASLSRIPRATCCVIPNGVEIPDQLPTRTWSTNGKTSLLFLGRLDPKKGIENLLHAIYLLRDSNIWLDVCGTGNPVYAKGLRELSESLGLAQRVKFLGHVEGEAKTGAFLRADVCVIPSYSENFGMVVAEALAHGVPVIASRATPWADVEPKGCGLWVTNDPNCLAEAITRIRGMNLQEMGGRGRAWMQENFGWDGVAHQILGLYEHLRSTA